MEELRHWESTPLEKVWRLLHLCRLIRLFCSDLQVPVPAQLVEVEAFMVSLGHAGRVTKDRSLDRRTIAWRQSHQADKVLRRGRKNEHRR